MRRTATQQRSTERWIARPGNPHRLADEAASANGCWFDPGAGKHVVEFFARFLRHSKGEWAGEPFRLFKWQADHVIQPLFGWKRADGTRRYRTAYIEVPKKQGKSSMCSGLALYGLLGDGEAGSEVYSAAASRDQATIVYQEAVSMAKASPSLMARITLQPAIKRMFDEKTQSWYRALSADAGTNEGLNIHFLIMDEMHAQPNDKFWNTLMYGGAARRQPLMVIITTAGVDQDSLCYEYHTKAMQIQQGLIQDESFFAYVRSAEWAIARTEGAAKETCWKDPRVWKEANPSMGHTMSLESFREDFEKAVQSPRLENAFKRYRLNIWTQQEERWLPMDAWAACGDTYSEAELLGQVCYAGLDLASVSDFCAFVLWFPDAGNAILPYFWIPQETVNKLEAKGDPLYVNWVRHGYLQTTEGNITDYDVIREDIRELGERFQIREIAFDRYNSTQLITQLQGDSFECVAFGQGFLSMSAPSKEFERLILGHEVRHNNQPVMTWCVGNVAVQKDAAGNLKPSKALSKKKVDGVVAALMALGRILAREPEDENIYDTRGLIVL